MSNVETMDWTLRLSDTKDVGFKRKEPLRFTKEAIFAGEHFDGKRKFKVTEADIDHWVKTGNQRSTLGIRTPLPILHTDNPEANRGWVDRFEKRVDASNGRVSLYVGGKVRDEEAKKTLKANDVSIFVPKEHETVHGIWERPIAHVAITSTPRVKGLGEFELALSEPSPPSDKCEKCGKVKECSSCKKEPEEMELSEVVGYDPTDHGAIDGKAAAIAKTDGRAYLVSENDRVLVLPKSELNGRTPYREMV